MTSYSYEVLIDGTVKETAATTLEGSINSVTVNTTTQTTKSFLEFQTDVLQQINFITSQISKFNTDLSAANARLEQIKKLELQVNAILNQR